MNCQTCEDTRFTDARKAYKNLYEQAMAEYIPLFILCPTCTKKYRCEKCNSENVELLFPKIALSVDDNLTKIKCLNCEKND